MYLRAKYIGNFITAAFKIFLEMKSGKARFNEFPHGMEPYERSVFWLDLCIDVLYCMGYVFGLVLRTVYADEQIQIRILRCIQLQ